MISNINTAWKIGFSDALTIDHVLEEAKRKWVFKLGKGNAAVERAYKHGFISGRHCLNIVIKERLQIT